MRKKNCEVDDANSFIELIKSIPNLFKDFTRQMENLVIQATGGIPLQTKTAFNRDFGEKLDEVARGTELLNLKNRTTELANEVTDFKTLFNDKVIDLKKFGAKADGVTDDSAPFLEALNSGYKVIDGAGNKYKIEKSIVLTKGDITLQNMILDVSTTDNNRFALEFKGEQKEAILLSSDSDKATITVEDTSSFSAGEYAFIESSEFFSSFDSVLLGETVRIKEIVSNTQLELYARTNYKYFVYHNAKISPIKTVSNIKFRNVMLIGKNSDNKAGVCFSFANNIKIENSIFYNFPYAGVELLRCIDSQIHNSQFHDSNGEGLAYGVVIANASTNSTIQSCIGNDLRHLVTIGGREGVNTNNIICSNTTKCKEAGIDAHPACDKTIFSNNIIECAEISSGSSSGIVYQGRNANIRNNIISKSKGEAILIQLMSDMQSETVSVAGNTITGEEDSNGILVEARSTGGSCVLMNIIDNNISGDIDKGIYLHCLSDYNSSVTNVSIKGNSIIANNKAIYVNAENKNILGLNILGNTLVGVAASEAIYLYGTTGWIQHGIISNNSMLNFVFGLRFIHANDILAKENFYNNVTKKNKIDDSSLNLELEHEAYIRIVNNFTLEEEIKYIVCDTSNEIEITLPDIEKFKNREIFIRSANTGGVKSSEVNILPLDSNTPTNEILSTAIGDRTTLRSNGSHWVKF